VHGSTHQDDALRDVRKAKSEGVEMVRDVDQTGIRKSSGEMSRRRIDRDVVSRKGFKT